MASSPEPKKEIIRPEKNSDRRPNNIESLDSKHDIVLIPNDTKFDAFNFSKTTMLIISIIILLLLLILLIVNDTTCFYK